MSLRLGSWLGPLCLFPHQSGHFLLSSRPPFLFLSIYGSAETKVSQLPEKAQTQCSCQLDRICVFRRMTASVRTKQSEKESGGGKTYLLAAASTSRGRRGAAPDLLLQLLHWQGQPCWCLGWKLLLQPDARTVRAYKVNIRSNQYKTMTLTSCLLLKILLLSPAFKY